MTEESPRRSAPREWRVFVCELEPTELRSGRCHVAGPCAGAALCNVAEHYCDCAPITVREE